MKINNIFQIVFLLACFQVSEINAQIHKKRAEQFSCRTYESGSWSDWSELTSLDLLITIDATKQRVIVYSNVEQQYDIISIAEPTFDKDGDEFTEFTAINEDGIKCTLVFSTIHSKGGFQQLYVRLSEFEFVYYFNLR